MKSIIALNVTLIILALFTPCNALVITSMVGDEDGLGFGVQDGELVPVPPAIFDNRDASEISATNGAQNTDRSTTGGGITIDYQDYIHSFSIPLYAEIESAIITLGIGGLESNDNNPSTKLLHEDELFLDGINITDAFEPLILSGYEFDANYSINVPNELFNELLDGSVIIRIDANAKGTFGDGAEPVFLDYSKIEIYLTPEPPVEPTIQISVLPFSKKKLIKPLRKGVIPVAVFGSEIFDVTDIDATTLAFGPNGAPLAHKNGPHLCDVNEDGFTDLMLHFRTQKTGIEVGDSEVCLTGNIIDGTFFEACDEISTKSSLHNKRLK